MKIVKTIAPISSNDKKGEFIVVSKGGDFGEVLESHLHHYRVKIKGYEGNWLKTRFTKPVEGTEKIMRILYNV